MTPLAFIKLAWTFRKQLAIALAAIAVIALFLTYRYSLIQSGKVMGRAEVQAKWDEAVAVSNRETERRNTAYKALEGERDKARAEVEAIRNRPLPAPRTLIREVPTDAPVSTCPRLGPVFLQNYNALSDAADSRAATP